MQLILLSEPVWIKICRKIDEISRKVSIAGVIGYDSIRKHLADCVMNTVTYKKEIKLGQNVVCKYVKQDEKYIVAIYSEDLKVLHSIVELQN